MFASRFPDAVIESAGTGAPFGRQAHSFAIQTCSAHGIDIGSHRSKPVSSDLLKRADLVLAMESAHIDHILRHFPWCTGKVRRFAPPPLGDIPDLLGEPFERFEQFHSQAIESSLFWAAFLGRPTELQAARNEGH